MNLSLRLQRRTSLRHTAVPASLPGEHLWLAQRVQSVRLPGVRKILDVVRKVKDPVNIGPGEPDFDVPLPIGEEAVKWTRKGFDKYPPSGGKTRTYRSSRGTRSGFRGPDPGLSSCGATRYEGAQPEALCAGFPGGERSSLE